jgi:hypothetical protein
MVVIPWKSVRDIEANTNNAFVTRKEQDDLELSIELRKQGVITTPGQPF